MSRFVKLSEAEFSLLEQAAAGVAADPRQEILLLGILSGCLTQRTMVERFLLTYDTNMLRLLEDIHMVEVGASWHSLRSLLRDANLAGLIGANLAGIWVPWSDNQVRDLSSYLYRYRSEALIAHSTVRELKLMALRMADADKMCLSEDAYDDLMQLEAKPYYITLEREERERV